VADDALRRALRLADAAPDDEGAQAEAVAAHRRADLLAPARVLARTTRWRPVARDVARWFERPLEESDGAGADEIAAAAERVGGMPLVLREWFALSGARRLDGAGPIRAHRLHQVAIDERSGEPLIALFYEEGMWGRIGVRPADREDEDPPVFAGGEDGDLHPIGEPLSRFLHHATVGLGAFGSQKADDHGARGRVPRTSITAAWPRLPFPLLTAEEPDMGFLLFGDDEALVRWHTTGSFQLVAQDGRVLGRARERLPDAHWS